MADTLDPQLEHNRVEFDHFLKRKRQVAVVFVLALVPMMIFVPSYAIPTTFLVLFGAAVVAMGYYEWKRVVVFRRDVRERHQDLE